MSNDYFQYGNTLIPGASAKAEEVATELQGVQAGFDLLPQPRPTGDGFLVPFHVATPTEATHAANLGQLEALEAAAASSAAAALVSENAAAASEAAALASESAAAASEGAASSSEINAATSEANALKWAENPEDVVVSGGLYSAKHWAAKAAALTSGARAYQGGWDASGGTMPISSPTGTDAGKFWRITVAGTLPTVGAVQVEDELSINATPAYEVLPSNNSVQSVNGYTGTVVLAASDVGAATSSHNHDASYAALGHNHDSAYAAAAHNHAGVYATAGHTHASTDLTDSANLARNNAALDISAHWEWQDNYEARFGNDADLRISHSGTNSFLDNYTGSMYFSSYAHGAQLIFRGEDAGGVMRTLINADPDDYVYLYSQGTWRLRAEPTGAQCNGAFVATGNITAYSDARLKENITRIEGALSKVLQLSGNTFNRIDLDGEAQAGVLAQQVQAVLPEAVTERNDGTLAVSLGGVIALLVEAIKELANDTAK